MPLGLGAAGTNQDSLGPFAIPPTPTALLAVPLDYLFAESCRIVRLCGTLDMVASDPGRFGPLAGPALTAFLRVDFPHHLDDMEKDLLPLIEGALLVGDGVDDALAQLSREHAVDRIEAGRLMAALGSLIDGRRPESTSEIAALARAFAEAQRRHAAWETAILYPLARSRLQPAQLRDLSQRLARRRRLND